MGRFSGLAKVRSNSGGMYFHSGAHLVEIEEVKFFTAKDGVDTFIVGARVLETNSDRVVVGSSPSQVVKIKPQYLATVMGNVKQFAAAATGVENPDTYVPEGAESLEGDALEEAQDAYWEEVLEILVDEKEQALKGTKIFLSCSPIPTKAGGTFTKHKWGPLADEGQTLADFTS